ncbi:MAG: hypothetical protein SGILL_009754, partial [Bacillariaceae sp.]
MKPDIQQQQSFLTPQFLHQNAAVSPPKPRKQVRFSYVTIRNYDMTLGDNPSVTAGPPIQLDWVYEEISPLPVRDFENFKVQRHQHHNPPTQFQYQDHGITSFVMPIAPDGRKGILKRAGFTDWQIQQTERSVKKIQTQRQRTLRSAPFYRVEYAMRSAGRKLQRTMGTSSATGTQSSSQSSSMFVHSGFDSGGDSGWYPGDAKHKNLGGNNTWKQQDDATTAQLTDTSSIWGDNNNQNHSGELSANARAWTP